MQVPSDPLSKTKPLSDPVRAISILTLAGAAAFALYYVVLLTSKEGPLGPLLALLPIANIALSALSLVILVGPWGKPNAIYLRAFRTDRSTAKLRAELAAILGPEYRLSGIRPPQERTSIFVRFLLPGIVALRYAGSKFMQLEAGDDWMARLWKTYQSTRLVFIDVRDVTPHVHQEIRMTLAAMGPERCVFLVGDDKTESEWRNAIAEIAGAGNHPEQFHLLEASEESIRTRRLEAGLKVIVKSLPNDVPGQIDRGREFVLANVTEEQLQMSRRTSPMAVISAVIALALSASLALVPSNYRAVILIPLVIVGVPIFIAAVFRAMGRIRRLARAGHGGAAFKATLLLGVAFLPVVLIVAIVGFAIPNLKNLKRQANEMSALATIRTIIVAEIMYESTYPANGYACSLTALGGDPNSGQPSPAGAQLLQADLAGGKKSGYSFAIGDCSKVSVNGTDRITAYRVTATPLIVGQTGNRSFCSDQSGTIKYDPSGGTNCTQPLAGDSGDR